MRRNGQNVWYLMARDEGHGFRKKINRDYYLNSTALFFEKCLER
jgi:dipeptidyl aminopeptidase/acylaminoacyl peptidase